MLDKDEVTKYFVFELYQLVTKIKGISTILIAQILQKYIYVLQILRLNKIFRRRRQVGGENSVRWII